jgi:hypothetical protein
MPLEIIAVFTLIDVDRQTWRDARVDGLLEPTAKNGNSARLVGNFGCQLGRIADPAKPTKP